MAVLSLAGISAVLLTYFFTYGSLERTALASHVPWLGNYLYAIIQAVIVIFLSGNFLQSDRKLDTTGGYELRIHCRKSVGHDESVFRT